MEDPLDLPFFRVDRWQSLTMREIAFGESDQQERNNGANIGYPIGCENYEYRIRQHEAGR